MSSSEFKQIQDDYYTAWFRFHPEAALDVGIVGYEDRLRPYTDEDQGALLTLNEKLLAALEELDESALDGNQMIDLELMRGAAFLEMEEILNFDWRKRDPEAFLPIHALYQLTVKEPEDFAAALRHRLSAFPAYLRNCRQYIGQEPEQIPAAWLDSAMVAIESGVDYLQDLPKQPIVQVHRKRLKDLDALIADTTEAIHQYGQFLEQEIGPRADGDFAVGQQRFTHLLRYRHFLNVEPKKLYDFGWRLFDETNEQLVKVCQRITGSSDSALLDKRIASQHPVGESVLSAYRDQMQAAREFTLAHELLAFPAAEQLSVLATPVFLRHKIPFAAYEPPTRNDDEQQGYYFVTPSADSAAKQSALMLMHTCVHEAYPGHHLQFVTANQNANSCTLPRMLNRSASLYEGWALYCEQLMFEQGFLNQPENEYILLKDRLWRALRVVLDVAMQTQNLSVSDAAEMMQSRLGFTPDQARAELNWYSRAPTVPLGYAAGWAMINALRELTAATASKRSLRSFHDNLLSCGSIALALGINRVFGQDTGDKVGTMVFGEPTA